LARRGRQFCCSLNLPIAIYRGFRNWLRNRASTREVLNSTLDHLSSFVERVVAFFLRLCCGRSPMSTGDSTLFNTTVNVRSSDIRGQVSPPPVLPRSKMHQSAATPKQC
jgi:hypothetical protein